ncbi:hypothetical protein V2J09_017714 [Rumex salicifolius]
MRHGWSNSSFSDVLELIKEILPEDNSPHASAFEAKKILCSTGMNYERILNMTSAQNHDYGESRYKKKGLLVKVLWYFPILFIW